MEEGTPITIVRNKCDLAISAVDEEEAEKYASDHGFDHVSASAKTGQNVDYLFECLAQKIKQKTSQTAANMKVTGGRRRKRTATPAFD